MASNGKPSPNKNHHFYQSFGHAVDGLGMVFRSERNFRFHLFMASVVVILGILFQLQLGEWMAILFAILMVVGGEILNTIIERIVDLIVGDHYHPLAKQAKDMAAGLVVCTALFAIIVGCLVFVPHILYLLKD